MAKDPFINYKFRDLKIFGSTTYMWIIDAKRIKLDSKSHKLMLTGYSDNHKSYWLSDVDNDGLMLSKIWFLMKKVGTLCSLLLSKALKINLQRK